jgi:type VI secretion system secreted protein Hcp
MKYGTIKGDVQADKYKDWIELNSVQLGVGRGIAQGGGSGLNREAGKASVSEVTVTKQCDESSVYLFQEACKGLATDCEIHLTTVQKDTLQPYLQFKLTDCLISGFSTSSGGDRPTESVSLNFLKIETAFTPYDTKGGPGTPIKANYDMTKATSG